MKKLTLMLFLLLAACGKMSDNVAYPDSGYPHSYPNN